MVFNGEGIHGTRPYLSHAEGKTRFAAGSMQEKAADWQPTDFRFTRKGSAVYAFMMRGGQDRAVIYNLGRLNARAIASVQVCGRPVRFEQKDGALFVELPQDVDGSMPVCIKTMLDG
jgi:alpha-L-fucosidase